MNSLNQKHRLLAVCIGLLCASSSWSFTPSNQPPESTSVPGNVLMPLSVEFPTGLQVSYPATDYVVATKYLGYFDNRKCYSYSTTNEVFSPAAAVTAATGACADSTHWSGNVLNWLTMTNLDQFRSVMTGGTRDNFSSKNATHAGDTTGRTVLIRSFSDRNAYNPTKRIRTTTLGVPTSWRGTDKWVRSAGYGSKFVISNADNFVDWDGAAQRSTCSTNALPGKAGTSACFNIRVEVCLSVGGIAREDNCQTRYSGVAKPEGLVQQYANNLRFAAFGYLNETGNGRNGGVLRSAMKSVGKLAATSNGLVITNPNPEWDDTTGAMVFNPDPTDASATTGVTQSGLMNYLNKFGYAAGYKGNDPVSELFYAAQLYMRGRAAPAEYANNLTTNGIDGFPVITGNNLLQGKSRDPIINTCQKNFMLAIGDIYTHCDGNLPGSTKVACTAGTPTDPDGLNVQDLWTTVRKLEGIADNGWTGGADNATPYVAGLAYWGNTSDIRSDLTGKQTISTYFVDVLENGNGVGGMPAAGLVRSQYWLAAKYGGFNTTITGGSATNPNTLSTSWDLDGNGVPDTWFAGSSPELMKSGLSAAFADIASKSSVNSAASAAVTSTRQTSDSQIIYASYNPQDWSGTVRACSTTQTAAECRDTPTWEASNWFKTTSPTAVTTPLTASTRKIITSWRSSTAFTKSAFQWAAINSDQKNLLKTSPADTLGQDRLNYLRGDRTKEGIDFRRRHDYLLGDVVNAGVGYLSGPGPALFGANFPGHAAYRLANKDRPPVVYAGSNDGMLHAFDASSTGATKGKELFGYIPSSVYGKLNGVSDLAFKHQYLVDSSPMLGDFQKTETENPTTTTWGTMLVGGLGAGGKGYYALDVSDQATFSTMSETALSNIAMWEFTSAQDDDLGYTYNEPSINPVTGTNMQIAKVADATKATGVWRVIVGNGYGSTNGKAALFMLDANSGTETKLIADSGTMNGLSTPTPIDTDRDGLVDTIYAGDLKGNLHKFQFSKIVAGKYVLATPSDTSPAWRYLGKVYASGEPITTAPSVDRGLNGIGWIVSFGTGKLNETADYTATSSAGFYSVLDDKPFTTGQSVANVVSTELQSIPLTAGSLPDGRATRTWTTPDLTGGKKGWKMSFTGGERVLSNSTLPPDTGTVLFATTKTSGDICIPGNTGYIMAVKLGTGASNSLKVNDVVVGGLALDSNGVNKVSNTYSDTNKQQTVVCNQDDCKPKACTTEGGCKGDDGTLKVLGSGAPRGRYSWREILTK